ncbi:MAG: ATP-binding protein, partial [Candidatus Hydrothermae bacterium]|nr:ATP-binding protein [Candidatus Hydrothermae bacterium]
IEVELGRLSGDLGRWRGYFVEAVRMGLERFKRGYDLRGVELEEDVDWGERGRELYRDHVMRYGEVIYNLLVNAYEALGGKGGRIRVYYGRDEGGGVVLEVEDNGVGMSEEEVGRMWRRGYSRKEGGTGMGLTEEVREFLERYGWVEVESEEGVGTVVRLYVR